MLTRVIASQRVFRDVVEGVVDEEEDEEDEEEVEVEAYRRDRVAVDPRPELLHRQRKMCIEDFMGERREGEVMTGALSL
jgi:CBS domain containing-hemolysin-like protein